MFTDVKAKGDSKENEHESHASRNKMRVWVYGGRIKTQPSRQLMEELPIHKF